MSVWQIFFLSAVLLNTTKLADDNNQPLEFRCDSMELMSNPNKTICRGNVIARKGSWMVCCDKFIGNADNKWQWGSFVCKKNVRVSRVFETAWADKATYSMEQTKLVLEGQPMLERGANLLLGKRIIIDFVRDSASINSPRGVMKDSEAIKDDFEKTSPIDISGPLPAKCPIKPRPNFKL